MRTPDRILRQVRRALTAVFILSGLASLVLAVLALHAIPLLALDFLKTEPFDAFVIDLMLPQMTGFELIERIRALPRTRLKPVIVCSAKDLGSEERRRLQQHANMRVGERAGGPSTLIEELRLIVAAQQTATPIEESCRVG